MATTAKYGIYYDDPTMLALGRTQDQKQAASIEAALDVAVKTASPFKSTKLAAGVNLDSLEAGTYASTNEVDAKDAGLPTAYPGNLDTSAVGAHGATQEWRSLDGRVFYRQEYRDKWSDWIEENNGHVRRDLLKQKLKARKGGRIGLNGLSAFALRFDDDHADFRTKILPLLVERGIPFTRITTSDSIGGNAISADEFTQMQNYCLANGGEVWSKGRTGLGQTGMPVVYKELITPTADLRKKMPRIPVDCFTAPGGQGFDGMYNAAGVEAYAQTFAGQQAISNHALVAGYFNDSYWYPLDGELADGYRAYGFDAYTYERAVQRANFARTAGTGLVFQWTASGLLKGMGLNDFTKFLDFLKFQRETDNIELLTVSGLTVADINSSSRNDLIQMHESVAGSTTYSAQVQDPQYRAGVPGSTRMLQALVKGAPGATVTSVVGDSTKTSTIPSSGWLRLYHPMTIPLDVTATFDVTIDAYAKNVHLYAV